MTMFAGQTVLISGAAGGFGKRTAERFAAAGANLVLTDVKAEQLAEVASGLDCDLATLSGDIAEDKLSLALVELAVQKFGGLDIAINNAGIAQNYAKIHQLDPEEARRVIDVDLMGVFYAMRHQLELMGRQYNRNRRTGTIVNIASIAGLVGAPRLSVYSAAKHGVVGLTRSAAAEYATKGIRVNAVCPSFARTNMATESFDPGAEGTETLAAHLVRGVPMKRLAEIDEVVEVILFAASPSNSFMTGQAIAVDGGIEAI